MLPVANLPTENWKIIETLGDRYIEKKIYA